MAIDYESDAGRVRLLIPDTDETTPILTDEQIAAFLAMETGPKRAAALALETIASNEAMVGKVIKTQDVSTDGAKVSAELRARAAELRRQADDEDGDGSAGLPVWEFPGVVRSSGEMSDSLEPS
ncbi:hypothetical protein [Actinomadura luteofluorescens]|uniref:hypothetical protein n=1 Tax=Actinomadura luteofluorescens TaxID=46163 RepID=UPI003D8BDD21